MSLLTVEKSQIIDRLQASRDFLSWNGWAKGRNIRQEDDGTFSYCIGGALIYGGFRGEMGSDGDWHYLFDACFHALDQAAAALTGQEAIFFQSYNDRIAETKEEALALYDYAIRELQEAV